MSEVYEAVHDAFKAKFDSINYREYAADENEFKDFDASTATNGWGMFAIDTDFGERVGGTGEVETIRQYGVISIISIRELSAIDALAAGQDLQNQLTTFAKSIEINFSLAGAIANIVSARATTPERQKADFALRGIGFQVRRFEVLDE